METPIDPRWQRLMILLGPIHGQALATARRLCRSPGEGDDLYHDALLAAFDRLSTLREESRFRSWFFALLLNRHRNQCRRAFWKRFVPWEQAFSGDAGPVGERGEGWAARDLRAGRVARALARLTPEQREAVVLFEVSGFSLEEVAMMQRVSVPAVKSRLVRARASLRRSYLREQSTGDHLLSGLPAVNAAFPAPAAAPEVFDE